VAKHVVDNVAYYAAADGVVALYCLHRTPYWLTLSASVADLCMKEGSNWP